MLLLKQQKFPDGQQFFKIFRLACQCSIKCFPQSIPLRGFRFITQPFIIALAPSFRLLDNRQTVLDAQCITEPPDGFWTAPEIAKLPITIKIHRRNNNMRMERILSRIILSIHAVTQTTEISWWSAGFLFLQQSKRRICYPAHRPVSLWFFTSFRVYTKLGMGPHSFLLLGKQEGGCPPSADCILPELQIIFRINLDGTLVQAVKAFIRYYNHLLC